MRLLATGPGEGAPPSPCCLELGTSGGRLPGLRLRREIVEMGDGALRVRGRLEYRPAVPFNHDAT